MADWRSIHRELWEDDAFLALPSAGAQNIFQYLLVNRSECGLFKLSRHTLHFKTKSTPEDFEALITAGFIKWDGERQLVWLINSMNPKFFRPSPNTWIRVRKELDKLGGVLRAELFDTYAAVWVELSSPSGTPSKAPGRGPSNSNSNCNSVGEEKVGTDIDLTRVMATKRRPFLRDTRYETEPLDTEDIKIMREVLTACQTQRDGRRPRSDSVQQKFLDALDKFPLPQVVKAAHSFVEKGVVENGEVTWPYDRYFLGFVRNTAAWYLKNYPEKGVKKDDVPRQKDKGGEAPRVEGSAHHRNDSGFHTSGDILRKL
jgi:hypothetical protein